MEEEVPPEMKELLQLLEEKPESDSQPTESVSHVRLLSIGQEDGFRKVYVIDTGENWRIFDIPWAKQSPLRLLKAIGNCGTLRELYLAGHPTSEELEAVLTRLQWSSTLERIELIVPDLTLSELEDGTGHDVISVREGVWIILGNVLGTSCTLRTLCLEFATLNEAVVQNLASALRGNSNSALEKLSLYGWERPSAAKAVAEMVSAAPKLSKLELYKTGVLEDDDLKALSNALVQKTSLKSLGLGDVEQGGSALLLESLAGEGCNKSIIRLHLKGFMGGLGDCLPIILSSNQTLQSVKFSAFERAGMSPTQSRKVGQSLCSNTSLEKISITFQWSYISKEGIDSLREILSGTKKPIISLTIQTWNRRATGDLWGSSSVSDVVITNIASIRMLQLELEHVGRERVSEVEHIIQSLQTNSTVDELRISYARGRKWSHAWKHLFVSLRYNTTITGLEFFECDCLGEDEFRDLVGVLQVNLTLKYILLEGTSWKKEGKAALIQEALSRNAKQQSYFSILQDSGANLEFEGAKAARLFLCGSPRAGKTKLRQTLTRLVPGTSWWGDKFAELKRTKGIEVEMLRDDHDMQIAMWDLGGQTIFRTLQHILFPRTNQTFMFLFVFSVYDEERGCMKKDLDDSFKTDLEEWLRFIASNIQITGTTLPMVLVVISHMDKMKVRSIRWAERIVNELRVEFQDALDLSSSETLYQMDAREKKEVAPLKNFIFHTFGELLRNKAHIVPKVCSGLNSALAKRRKYFRHRPIWRSPDFYKFCLNGLKEDAIPFPILEIEDEMNVFEAMASYLHDTGSIIRIPNSDWIVIDPNWLTNVFLGELISIGHNFHVNADDLGKPEVGAFHSRDGFVSYSVLHQLLCTFISNHPKVKELNEEFLIDILIQLDLCYKVEDGDAKYYIPTIVCEDPRFGRPHFNRGTSSTLQWSSPPQDDQEFVGFRVQCENPRRMRMTAALFPRFQIHTQHKLLKGEDVAEKDMICSRNYMHLHMNGHEILVERSDLLKSHVDVIVKCSKHKSRETAVRYVKKSIIEELREFCASPKGCPGIVLVIGILQTECVKQLVSLDFRGTTLVEKLVEKLEADIFKQVEEIKLESWSESTSSLLNYEHCWPPIPGYLPREFELAQKLLSENEVESATSKLLEKHQHRLTTLDDISKEMNEELEKTECVPEVNTPVLDKSTSSLVETSLQHQSTLGRMLARMDRSLKGRIDHLQHKIEDIASTLTRIETNLDRIINIQYRFESLLKSFNSKVDRLIGYAESLEGSRTPKRPYLSFDNVSPFEKVIAVFRVGTPVRLHFMCESSTGTHIVKNQPGLLLSLNKENMEWLRCIYDISFKMMYYLVKAGLHLTLGLGNAVPELGGLQAALPLSIAGAAVDTIQIDKNMVSVDMRRNMPLEEAWSRLRSVLAPELENRCTSLFNLYKVKYVNLETGEYAWLCEQCMARDVGSRSLQCC